MDLQMRKEEKMNTLRFDLARNDSSFKILNATNGGPWHKRHANDQYRSNIADYKASRIPYSRNHDSGVVGIYAVRTAMILRMFFQTSTQIHTIRLLMIFPVRMNPFWFVWKPERKHSSGWAKRLNIRSRSTEPFHLRIFTSGQ